MHDRLRSIPLNNCCPSGPRHGRGAAARAARGNRAGRLWGTCSVPKQAAHPLQGPGTDEAPLRELREATAQGRACVVQLMNYRRNGDAFVNYLSVTPIHDAAGVLTHYVGIQADITELVNHKNAELAAKHAAVQARAPRGSPPVVPIYLHIIYPALGSWKRCTCSFLVRKRPCGGAPTRRCRHAGAVLALLARTLLCLRTWGLPGRAALHGRTP